MTNKIQEFNSLQVKKSLPDIAPGDTVRVHQKIKEKDKERIQAFEGVVLARKHGNEIGATITIRKVVAGVGVEKIIPLHSPIVEKIEILKKSKVKRSKLYYLRSAKGRKARLKRKEFAEILPVEEKTEKKEEPASADASGSAGK